MHSCTSLFSWKRRTSFLVLTLCAAALFGARTAAQTAPVAGKEPVTFARISELAHRLMIAGVARNALTGADVKPWHMKMEFQVTPFGEKKPVSGTMEEWYVGPSRWARAFKSTEQSLTGDEWSVSETARYESKPSKVGFDLQLLDSRVARPVIDPLFQTALIEPGYEMDVKHVTTAGIVMNCVAVSDPPRPVDQANPDWLFPTMCFDSDSRLRLTATPDTTVKFEDQQPFEERAVARDVKVMSNGALIAEMKVKQLEPLADADGDLVKPAKGAIALPYTIEPGHPKPVSVYEVGASVPIQPDGFPFRGSFAIPVIIHKDGSVKARNDDTSFWSRDLKDALVKAIDKWKYKPYVVDGQPVQVAWTVVYILDGKPFVPSYERTEPPAVPPQQDGSVNQSAGAPARRRYGH